MNKFEAVDENAPKITFNTSNTEDVTNLDSICHCESKNLSSLCNDTKLLDIISNINSSTFIVTKKLVALNDAVFVVIVSSDFVAIHWYDDTKEELLQRAGEFFTIDKRYS